MNVLKFLHKKNREIYKFGFEINWHMIKINLGNKHIRKTLKASSQYLLIIFQNKLRRKK